MQGGLTMHHSRHKEGVGTNLVLAKSTSQALCTPGSRDRSNLYLGKTKHGIFGGVDDVALQMVISITGTHMEKESRLTASEISKPPPSYNMYLISICQGGR